MQDEIFDGRLQKILLTVNAGNNKCNMTNVIESEKKSGYTHASLNARCLNILMHQYTVQYSAEDPLHEDFPKHDNLSVNNL